MWRPELPGCVGEWEGGKEITLPENLCPGRSARK